MSRLSTFFNGCERHFGVFYPEHYLVAMFPSMGEANRARQRLYESGRRDEDAIVVAGEEVVSFADEHLRRGGLWGMLMTELSRAFGTEAVYADRDVEMARRGAALLAVRCRTHQDKTGAWQCLEASRPATARYYSFGGIEHLAGET
jgi:hypothetical protein